MTQAAGEPFLELQPKLLSVAYRILGSAADAEEVVQDAFIRWQRADRSQVRSPEAFLTTIVTRLSFDRLALARTKREHYVGPWLPEPISSDWPGATGDPLTLSLAFMLLLEKLTPLERAVFVLHEAFDYEHKEIGAMLGRTEAACRQLLKRAKAKLKAERPVPEATSADNHEQLLKAFAEACYSGDVTKVCRLLKEDVTFYSDGGGKAAAALRPIVGRAAVGQFILSQMPRKAHLTAGIEGVNGRAAIVVRQTDGSVEDVLDLSIRNGLIDAVLAVRSPEKLHRLGHRP